MKGLHLLLCASLLVTQAGSCAETKFSDPDAAFKQQWTHPTEEIPPLYADEQKRLRAKPLTLMHKNIAGDTAELSYKAAAKDDPLTIEARMRLKVGGWITARCNVSHPNETKADKLAAQAFQKSINEAMNKASVEIPGKPFPGDKLHGLCIGHDFQPTDGRLEILKPRSSNSCICNLLLQQKNDKGTLAVEMDLSSLPKQNDFMVIKTLGSSSGPKCSITTSSTTASGGSLARSDENGYILKLSVGTVANGIVPVKIIYFLNPFNKMEGTINCRVDDLQPTQSTNAGGKIKSDPDVAFRQQWMHPTNRGDGMNISPRQKRLREKPIELAGKKVTDGVAELTYRAVAKDDPLSIKAQMKLQNGDWQMTGCQVTNNNQSPADRRAQRIEQEAEYGILDTKDLTISKVKFNETKLHGTWRGKPFEPNAGSLYFYKSKEANKFDCKLVLMQMTADETFTVTATLYALSKRNDFIDYKTSRDENLRGEMNVYREQGRASMSNGVGNNFALRMSVGKPADKVVPVKIMLYAPGGSSIEGVMDCSYKEI